MDAELQPGGLKREAQPCRRGLGRGGERAKQERDGMARFGRHGKALQLGVARLLQPRRKRMAAPGAQCLLRRPERIAAARRGGDQELREIEPGGSQRGRIRNLRRTDPQDAVTGACQRRQRRQYEPELADTRLIGQELGEPLARPAASGQLDVQGRETRGLRRNVPGQSPAAPHRVALQDGIESLGTKTHTVFSYSMEGLTRPLSGRS